MKKKYKKEKRLNTTKEKEGLYTPYRYNFSSSLAGTTGTLHSEYAGLYK